MPKDDVLKKMIELKTDYKDASIEHWYSSELWEWQWWLSISLTMIPLYVWWKIVDKKRLFEIISYGLLVNMISAFLDVVGTEFVLWVYPIRAVPNIPELFPVDFVVIPIVFMILYQKYPGWKKYIILNIIVSFLFTFIAEPILVWINLYKLITWEYVYSFPIYVFISIIAKFTTQWFAKKQNE